jgi:hypothetical protein
MKIGFHVGISPVKSGLAPHFQDQMRGKMHGSMVVFGISPTEVS